VSQAQKKGTFQTFTRVLERYFSDYGGWTSLWHSPFVRLSFILNCALYSLWLECKWPELSMTVLPNLLGFSLGVYALLFSLMSPRLRKALKALPNSSGISYLREVNATFFHFILVQVIGIIWAIGFRQSLLVDLFSKTLNWHPGAEKALWGLSMVGSFCGAFLLIYSILLIVAASLAVFRLARIDPGE
jgi:hypothetical protein